MAETSTKNMVPRSTVRVGDLVHSSHGYDLLITKVDVRGNEGQTTELVGHLHGNPEAETCNEIYPSDSLIEMVRRAPRAWTAGGVATVTERKEAVAKALLALDDSLALLARTAMFHHDVEAKTLAERMTLYVNRLASMLPDQITKG